MRRHLAIVAVALVGCGGGLPWVDDRSDEVHVRRYESVSGETPPAESLGYTYGPMDDGWHCLINEVLRTDADGDKMRRVVVHELLNVLALDHGIPAAAGPGWYLWDSDTLPPWAPMPAEEAAWVKVCGGGYDLNVEADWLRDATTEARDFITDAAGYAPFRGE